MKFWNYFKISGPNTNNSQFLITLAPTPQLDGNLNFFW